MAVLSKEHYELIASFEKSLRQHRLFSLRFDKEDTADWEKGDIYQNGEVNRMFIVFRLGYALGKTI